MRRLWHGFFRWMLALAASALGTLRADQAMDIAQLHVETLGGRERIAALSSLRATGKVGTARDEVSFIMIAARPDKVRLETIKGGRSLVQASDGEEPAWEFDSGAWPAVYRDMPAATAKTFVADAEFDDPLVTAESRGHVLEYAGELTVEKRKLIRILVTRKLAETYSLLVDPDTYLIMKRVEVRTSVGGRKLQVVTHYDNFRPVAGVLLPHKILVSIDGQLTQMMQITKVEPNPKIEASTFTRPKVTVPGIQK